MHTHIFVKPSSDSDCVQPDSETVDRNNFVIPQNFAEFYERYPHHVRNFVRRHLFNCSLEEKQDRESELLVFLLTLPEISKYRNSGVNGNPNGCTDRIMTFDPVRSYGSSAARFFSYVNLILLNKFISLEKKTLRNPASRKNNYRILGNDEGSLESASITEDNLVRLSCRTRYLTELECDKVADRVHLSCFLNFIQKHNPELITVLKAMFRSPTFREAQQELKMDERLFHRGRHRLNNLYRCFTTGEVVPRQRRVYRERECRL
ncbi:hypothetical protein RBB77_23345 (plasmid) [Tunturibacter psychrotolerans]|uniref:Uncharacterized protein n=1 Tax=Tunturiibacter psychrotolerans TaxID=3069686 RepID=A0AAU7ZXX7_9BACT